MTPQITGTLLTLPYHTGTYDIMGGQGRSHCVMGDTTRAIGASASLLRGPDSQPLTSIPPITTGDRHGRVRRHSPLTSLALLFLFLFLPLWKLINSFNYYLDLSFSLQGEPRMTTMNAPLHSHQKIK